MKLWEVIYIESRNGVQEQMFKLCMCACNRLTQGIKSS